MNVWSSWLFRRGYKFKGVRLITLYSMNLVKLGTWLRWSTCDNECYQELSSMLHTLSYLALINNCDSVTCYPRQVIYLNQFIACVHQCLTTKWARTLLHVWTKVTFFFLCLHQSHNFKRLNTLCMLIQEDYAPSMFQHQRHNFKRSSLCYLLAVWPFKCGWKL